MSSVAHAASSSRGIYAEIVRLQQLGTRGALAIPVRLSDSVPFGPESRLLICADGSALGTVGGGPLEAEVLRKASEVVFGSTPCLLEFDLTDDEAGASGMICGGRCLVVIEPIRPDWAQEVYAAAARAEAEGQQVALITILRETGSLHKLAVLPKGLLVGSSGDVETDRMLCELAQRLGGRAEPSLIEEPVRALICPICPHPSLYVFGAGHLAIPLVDLADSLGFRVTVVDDRIEFANEQRFPQADHLAVASVREAFDQLTIGEGAYVVAITRGHALDEEVVAAALRTPARYIGMIGSKRKVAAIHQRLSRRGFTEVDLSRLHAPIGLDIRAETVEEIALSIAAELVAVRREA